MTDGGADLDGHRRPILVVSPQTIGTLDPADADSLFSLWTVFSKCKNSIENGRRLENMSWRLWNRELLAAADHDTDGHSNPSSSENLSISPDRQVPPLDQVPKLSPSRDVNTIPSPALLPAKTFPHRLSSEELQHLFQVINTQSTANDWERSKVHSASRPVSAKTYIDTPHDLQKPGETQPSAAPSYESGITSRLRGMSLNAPIETGKNDTAGTHAPAQSLKSGDVHHENVDSFGGLGSKAPNAPVDTGLLLESIENKRSDDHDHDDDYKSEDEDEDEDDERRLRASHRSATSTSIVRGFSPSNISVSFVNRVPSQKRLSAPPAEAKSEAGSTNAPAVPSQWKPTKARPDQLPRGKMFFIESSPSDSEFGGESVSSNEGSHGSRSGSGSGSGSGSKSGSGPGPGPGSGSGSGSGAPRNNDSARPRRSSTLSSNGSNHISKASSSSRIEDRKRSSLFPQAKSQGSKLFPPPRPSVRLEFSDDDSDEDSEDDDDTNRSEKALRRENAIADDDSDVSEEDDDDDDDLEEDDSEWDSVDDESDSSFDEQSFFVREGEMPKKPLTRPSLLSSLFLNKHELLQEQVNKSKRIHVPPTRVGEKLPVQPTTSLLAANMSASRSTNEPVRGHAENILNAAIATHGPPPGAMSPRTTRRNMLATELSESLRRNLLYERQQSSISYNGSSISAANLSNPPSMGSSAATSPTATTASAASAGYPRGQLKRSHTAAGVMSMPAAPAQNDSNKNKGKAPQNMETWREELDEHNLDFNYHARGW